MTSQLVSQRTPGTAQSGMSVDGLHDTPTLFDRVSIRAIQANLSRPSPGLTLFLIGFNIMYFHPLIFPTTLYDPAELGTFRYLFLGWVLITLGAALESLNGSLQLLRRKPLWAFILIAAIILMTLRSWLDEEPVLSIITKSMAFYWLLLVPAIALQAKNWAWLWLTFLIQIPIGIIYSLYAFFIENATTRLDIISMVGQNFLALCLYMGILMFVSLPMMQGRLLIVASTLTLGFQLLQAYFFASRLAWFLVPMQLLLILYIFARLRRAKVSFKRVILVGVLALSAVLFFQLTTSGDTALESAFAVAYDALESRMLEKGTVVDTILENERWYEADAVISTMDDIDWLFGKGLAARWSAPDFASGEERFMVHNTWLNAFYWGGVLLFLAVLVPLVWALRVMVRSRKAIALCGAGYLILINLKFPAYLITFNTHEWILACLVVGICMLYEHDQSVGNSEVSYSAKVV